MEYIALGIFAVAFLVTCGYVIYNKPEYDKLLKEVQNNGNKPL